MKGLLLPPGALIVDSFEGIALTESPGGTRTHYLISGNNSSPLQRTLLIQFRLEHSP